MPEVYASNEVTAELLDPIDGSVITSVSIPYRRDLTISERPVYAQRGYHRSNTLSAAHLRSLGSVSLRKDADSLALAAEIKRWQKGVVFYALSSDLKGQRYRHPHLRVTFTNADGSTDVVTAYNVKLSDRSLSAPDGGIVGDSISLDVLGGFESKDGGYEPIRALDFARTGSATYLSTAGTLTTAGDGVARFGLPWVVRRNLLTSSNFVPLWSSSGATASYTQLIGPDGVSMVDAIKWTAGRLWAQPSFPNAQVTESVYVMPAGTAAMTINLQLKNNGTDTVKTVQSISCPPGAWTRITTTGTPDGATPGCRFEITGMSAPGLYVYGPQVEFGSTATPYQPTNATGVDLTHPLNGAGLVLEGQGTNILLHSENFGNAAWSNAGVTSTTAADPKGGATAGTLDLSVAGALIQQDTATAWGTNTFTGWMMLKGSTAEQRVSLRFERTTDGAIIGAEKIINLTTSWEPYFVTAQGNGSGNVRFRLGRNTATGTVNFALAQVEQNPFPTSYIPTTTTAATRQPDLCGIVPPHNLLKWSEDFSNSAWVTEGTGATQPTAAGIYTIGNLDNRLYQAITPVTSPANQPHTFAVSLKAGTLSGNVQIRIEDQSGTTIGSAVTVNTSDLSATDARTFYVTATPGASVTGLRVKIKGGSSGTGTIVLVSARLLKGSHPGAYVKTTDTPIPAPVSPALDPAWQQNGAVEFDMVLPPISTGKTYNYFGAELQTVTPLGVLRLFRGSGSPTTENRWIFDRKHDAHNNDQSRIRLDYYGLSAHDAKRRVRLEWVNYTVSGVRYMWQRLYIDGVLGSQQDVTALYGATAWAEIDPSRLVSDGNVFSVLSSLKLEYPTLPAGATPAV